MRLRQLKRIKIPALMHRKQLAQVRLKRPGLQLQLHKLQHDKLAPKQQLALLRPPKQIKIPVQMHRKRLAQVRLKQLGHPLQLRKLQHDNRAPNQ